MAGLAAAPIGKEGFLEVLSNKERATLVEGAKNRIKQRGTFLGLREEAADEERQEDGEQVASFAENDKFRRFLEASDDEIDISSEAAVAAAGAGDVTSMPGGSQENGTKKGNVLSTYRSSQELQRSLGHQRKVKSLENLRHELAAKGAAADDAKISLDVEEQKLRALKRQVAEQPRLDDSKKERELQERLSYQEREKDKAWKRLTDAEKARDLAELALHQGADDAMLATQGVLQDTANAAATSRERQADEVRRARASLQRERTARNRSKERDVVIESEAARRSNEAQIHQNRSKRRLAESLAKQRERETEAEQVRENHFQHNAQRVLQLKSSIDKINKQIHGQNEARRKKQQKVRQEHEQRKKALLEEGLNPYEVWRKEDMEADKEKQKQVMKAQQTLRSEKLMEQMINEDATAKKKLKEEKTQRVAAEEFQRQMGNYAKEKRIASYIRKVTIGHVDVLDPAGTALRIDPSKVTVQKTHAFGLGRVKPDEIKKVDRDIRAAKARVGDWSPASQSSAGYGASDVDTISENEHTLSDDPPEDKLWVPKLTKLEEQYLAAAKERQKQNITSVQRCWGKEFQGDAFLAKPSVITFNDFEVGKRYRQVIEVTNVSLTFNQFKLLPLEDKINDFFEITFIPPGRMSAGVTRYITLWFHPKVNQDINSTFPILAKTGRIDFPLRCTTKKTILTITPQDADANPVIDFGQVLSGESGHRSLRVRNSGALPASYQLVAVESQSELMRALTWEPQQSEFAARTSTSVGFTFKPDGVGSFATVLNLTISNGATGDAKLFEERRVLVRGSCIDVPIYAEKEEYDLKTCVYDRVFREDIVLHNRQSVAMKIHVAHPHQIIGELQMNPTVAYIQGHKQQIFSVKFCPKPEFLERHPEHRDGHRPNEKNAFRIQVRIVGADQVLPVCTALVGNLTTDAISFQPASLSFGPCLVGSSVITHLTLVNESLLPQRFAFVRLPSFLSVEDVPEDVLQEEEADASRWGMGTAVFEGGGHGEVGMLLPLEKKRVCVIYAPESATEMDYRITFKTITGTLCVRDFSIPCRGQGRTPPLILSHTQIDMASIPCGATSKESIELTNPSNVQIMINLMLPPLEVGCLSASPICCTLKPKEKRRLQVEFKPNEGYVKVFELPAPNARESPEEMEGEANPAAPTSPSGAGPAAVSPDGAVDGEEAKPPGPTPEEHRRDKLRIIRETGGRRWEVVTDAGGSVHATWKLPLYVRAKAKGDGSSGGQQDARADHTTMYLGVRTCVLPSVLGVDPAVLDFGEVTAQQRMILPVTLSNCSASEVQHLHMEPLPENACFTVLNAPRPIGTRAFKLMIEFNPQQVQIYRSTLRLHTQNTRVQVELRGLGVRPVLKIRPEDGVLQVGSVIYSKGATDYVTAELEILNESPFELCYKLDKVVPARQHHAGQPPFTLTPSSGVVKGDGSKKVTVTFRPHRPLAVFREKILVNVPNQKEPTFVHLYGHCFSYQVYAMPDVDFGPFGVSQASSAFVDSLAVGTGSSTGADGSFAYQNAQAHEFPLVFKHDERVKCILVGASVPPGTPKAPQNTPATTYEFQIVQSEFSSFFTVEAPEGAAAAALAKGPVQPGKPATRVAFRYKPPEDASLTIADTTLDLLGGIGKWITCRARGVLSGGFVPPDAPTTQEIFVELKAYLQQI